MLSVRVASVAACVLLLPASALARQSFETMGNRALGMGGAFVAVSSDTTATYWNPGGMAVGGPSPGGTFGWVRFQTRNRDEAPAPGPALRESYFTSFGGGPLGLGYGKFQVTGLFNGENGLVKAETLKVSQFGVTVLQSLVKGLILGTTLKLMRGYSASELVTASTAGDALDSGAALDGDSVNKFDYDIGIMIEASKVRIGVTIKNMQQPSFPSSAGTAIVLPRHARIGLAVVPTTGLTLAMDMDLDKAETRFGLRRMIAFGVESLVSSRTAFRGGMRWSLEGEHRRVGSVGFSFALKKGFWIDTQYTQGDFGGDKGYGATMRAGF